MNYVLTSRIALLLFASAAALAQPTDTIRVRLKGTCTVPEHGFLVINHDENNALEINLHERVWQGNWPGLPETSTASLYLSGTRTSCRVSKVVDGDKTAPVIALFTFDCSEQ
ncbi:MAG: hypothetical protein ACREMY_20430, partial [bacterium]